MTQILPDVSLTLNFLSNPPTVEDILGEVKFNSDSESRVRVFGRWVNIPRKQTAFGDTDTFYRFSGNTVKARPWGESQIISRIREELQSKIEEKFNFVLVNYYPDGNACIGWHSDDEKDLVSNSVIASLTLGAERDFLFRHKPTKELTKIKLLHNSLLLMGGETQKNYQHSLPKRKNVGPRINLTFRQMVV